ncbi:MAG: mannonate dehydratase [Pseudomonadota bacterium]
MIANWRWYGAALDAVTLPEVRQTGARGVVTALHEIPDGAVWPKEAIDARRKEIEAHGLSWRVCESLPVHDDIKRGSGARTSWFENYRQSLAHLAAAGIEVVAYNFMPVLDWTRTDLAHPTATGGTCLRFSLPKMVAFERYCLGRTAVEGEVAPAVFRAASAWYHAATEAQRDDLVRSVLAGMPGAADRYDLSELRAALHRYDGIGAADLRAHHQAFLEAVIPTAAELGISLSVHPDDPPRSLLGLPRIVSNASDVEAVLRAVDHPANGLVLCTGSLGAHLANDLPDIARRFADRIRFAHLRNVSRAGDGSFEEADHLDGDVDIVAVAEALLAEEARRGASGPPIHFRPDHGHVLLSDFDRDFITGYPLVGRLKGLAELRGVLATLNRQFAR